MHRGIGCRKTAESGAGARADTGNPGYSSVSLSFRRTPSNIAAYEFDDRFHGFDQEFFIDPEVNFFPFLAALQYPRLAQNAQVMRDGGTTQRRYRHNFADVQPLAGLERQQNALPMLVA